MGQCIAPCYDGLDALFYRHRQNVNLENAVSSRPILAPWTEPYQRGERSAAQGHWAKLRTFVRARVAFRVLLKELRIREVESLYDNNWSEVDTPMARQPSLAWRKVQALTSSSTSLHELLNDVRCKQAENLYAADWNALKPGESLMSRAAAAG